MPAQWSGDEAEVETENRLAGDAANAIAVATAENEASAGVSFQERLPWIGELHNPRVVRMLVVNDNGYLVPLATAGDFLRACRYFWHRTQDEA